MPRSRAIVAFRFDDYCNWSDTHFETRIFEAFSRRGYHLTIGVVPFECLERCGDPEAQIIVPLREDKLSVLERLSPDLFEIALHGYAHVQSGMDPLGPSEFAGQPPERQLRWIHAGSEILERTLGVRPVTFIPPWNRFDRHTLHALTAESFQVVAAGRKGPALCGPPVLLPETTGIWSLSSALNTADRGPGGPSLILVLFHAYNFVEQDSIRGRGRVEELESLLDEIASREEVSTARLKDIPAVIPNLEEDRYAEFVRYHTSRSRAYLPPQIAGDLLRYPSPKRSRGLRRTNTRRAIMVYVLVALGAGLAGWTGGSVLRSNLSRNGMGIACGVALLIILSYGLRDGEIGYRGRLALTLGFAATLGMLVSFV